MAKRTTTYVLPLDGSEVVIKSSSILAHTLYMGDNGKGQLIAIMSDEEPVEAADQAITVIKALPLHNDFDGRNWYKNDCGVVTEVCRIGTEFYQVLVLVADREFEEEAFNELAAAYDVKLIEDEQDDNASL